MDLDHSLPSLVKPNQLLMLNKLKVSLRFLVVQEIYLLPIILDLDLCLDSQVQQNLYQLDLLKKQFSLHLLDLQLRKILNLIKVLVLCLDSLALQSRLVLIPQNLHPYLNLLVLPQNHLFLLHILLQDLCSPLEVLQKLDQYLLKHLESLPSLVMLQREKQKHIMVLVHYLDSPAQQNPLLLFHQHSFLYLELVDLLQNPLFQLLILDLVPSAHSPVQQRPDQYLLKHLYSLSLLEMSLRLQQDLMLDLDQCLLLLDLLKQQKLYLRLRVFSLLCLDLSKKVLLQQEKLEQVW